MPGLQNLNNLSPLGNDQINSDWMSELTSDFSLIGESQESPILDSLRYHDFANDSTSPPSKLYETYSYDPRTQRARERTSQNQTTKTPSTYRYRSNNRDCHCHCWGSSCWCNDLVHTSCSMIA